MRNMDIDVYVVLGVTGALSTVGTILRFMARRMTKVSLWWDDWFAILAIVSRFALLSRTSTAPASLSDEMTSDFCLPTGLCVWMDWFSFGM